MKKLIFSLAFLALVFHQSSAQKYRDVLYLKNGSKIFGRLLEVSNDQYKIRLNDSTIFTFPSSEVDKYVNTKETLAGRKSKGPGFSLEGGLLLGSQSNEYDTPFSFNVLLHYSVKTRHVFGLGTGAEFLGKTYTPIFAEYRWLFHAQGVSPYFFTRAGYLAYFGSDDHSSSGIYFQNKDYSGGASFAIGTGISWAGNGIETNLSFAYRYAHTEYVNSQYGTSDVRYENDYNRLELKLGFRF